MSKNNGLKVGVASALLATAGAAALVSKNKKNAEQKKTAKKVRQEELNNFRNTERGKNAVNSKGIYYSNGNYCISCSCLFPCKRWSDAWFPYPYFRGYGSSRRCM